MINNSNRVIEARYNDSFTLFDVFNDSIIRENTEKFYVPEVQNTGSVFIKKDMTVTDKDGIKKIRYIYLNPKGKNITNPDASFIQIPNSCKGFLVRISISGSHTTPEAMSLDYIIDISKIKYKFDTVVYTESINGQPGSIVVKDLLKFENLDFTEYQNIEFDESIRNFMMHQKDLFEMYF